MKNFKGAREENGSHGQWSVTDDDQEGGGATPRYT